jgi:ankyrin repeat protein
MEAAKRQERTMVDQMFRAAHAGDFKYLSDALHAGAPVNLSENVTGDTPLMIVCRRGHHMLVKLCLQFGAKNDPHPQYGQTALHAAVDSEQYMSAAELLNAAAVSRADSGIVNTADPMGQTALHTAARTGNVKMLQLLVSHGADMLSEDDARHTCLHVAAAKGNTECLSFILDHGGDEMIEFTDSPEKNTPLHLAASNGHLVCVRLLLETAANVFSRNAKGQTAYNLACMRGFHAVGLLLLEYQNMNAQVHSESTAGRSALPTSLHTPSVIPHHTPSTAMTIDTSQFGNLEPSHSFQSPQMTVFQFSQYGSPSTDSSLPRPHTFASPAKSGRGTPLTGNCVSDFNISNSPMRSFPLSPDDDRAGVDSSREKFRGTSYNIPVYSGASTKPAKPTSLFRENETISSHERSSALCRPNTVTSFSSMRFREESNNADGGGMTINSYERASALCRPKTVTSFSAMRSHEGSGSTEGKGKAFPRASTTDSLSSVVTAQVAWHAESQDSYQDMPTREQKVERCSTGSESLNNIAKHTPHLLEISTMQNGDNHDNSSELEEVPEPIEAFYFAEGWWESYYTEDGYLYYLDTYTSHSQWEDPRDHGVVASDYGGERDSACAHGFDDAEDIKHTADAKASQQSSRPPSKAASPKHLSLIAPSAMPLGRPPSRPTSPRKSPRKAFAPRSAWSGGMDNMMTEFGPVSGKKAFTFDEEGLSIDKNASLMNLNPDTQVGEPDKH